MGLFDKFKKEEPVKQEYAPQSEQEAWMGIIFACGIADGEFSEAESDHLSRTFVFKSFFEGYDFISIYQRLYKVMQDIGWKKLLDKCVPFISEENKKTIFAITVNVVMADGFLKDDEKKVIQLLADKLQISDQDASNVVDVMMAFNKYNKEFTE